METKEERGSCNKDVFMIEDETEKKTEVNKKMKIIVKTETKTSDNLLSNQINYIHFQSNICNCESRG